MDQSIEQDIIPQYDESPDQMDNQPHDPKQSIPMELLNHSLDDQQFEQFYLQQVTQEFGDDLDKLRQSKDFNDNSLVLLIDALKQGVNIFDEEQRAVILNH